ncbi:N-6 DNA methylase [Borreliella garinii]|uniref:N-6 DNA methylase n=1 Tax=Borreliella garinii TaxID=29519 RepID=UPI00040654A9|nr:N-6 DNA methylase [Borreliella garinii]
MLLLLDVLKEYGVQLKENLREKKPEHSHRVYLKNLFDRIKPDDGSIIQCKPKESKETLRPPDYLIEKTGIIVGYIKVEDPGQDLYKILESPQIKRYKKLSKNILLTNYIEFILIKDGVVTLRESLMDLKDLEKEKIEIDTIKLNKVVGILDNFFLAVAEKIKNIEVLTSLLASRTRILRELIKENLELNLDEENIDNIELKFKKPNILTTTYETLIKAIYRKGFDISEFSDSIAQTITYGLFIAYLNNKSGVSIDFLNIKDFIPTNFYLMQNILKIIENISKKDEFSNINWILKELISTVNNIDSKVVFKQLSFDKLGLTLKDPYLYFYENFLAKYDRSLRSSKGVYYTPKSMVGFIVRSLHEILKKGFKLNNGFANKNEVKVLDFATGTGTFLLEVIKTILDNIPKESVKQEEYIDNHIFKNLYGFEYLIAPYVVSHLKLSQYLKDSCNVNFSSKDKRLKMFLTNTIDEKGITEKNGLNSLFYEDLFLSIDKENELVNEV